MIKFWNRQSKNAMLIYGLGLIYWITLVLYREITQQDIHVLRKNMITINKSTCNGWCVSHFIHYLLLGYFAPKYWLYFILIGLLFEIMEIPLNHVSKYIDSKIIEDTVTNSMGVITGLCLHKLYPNKLDLVSICLSFLR